MSDMDSFFVGTGVLVMMMGVAGLIYGLVARSRADQKAAAPPPALPEPYVCRSCRGWWCWWWAGDCSHAKRDSLMVSEGEWKGIEAWLEKWRGKPWEFSKR